ncbi:DNA polymerase ligase N-terminal domain-containing protein [Candidatus Methanodesulfokora washburnensis]|jgi:DNA ligase D-like protein (predicted 3'-phosphoesterase)|uniref:3'-phosphoesterase n=2 Tax=Candidatus Methanodesulfokora washburnensis TaxID=2478471 RepID=A0A3R9RMX3_9CREN|nr:DNA polymerase ligase N-terminal domain-containing protein [Candidatus Methanodesulfokores washburnensis]RSN74105.1 3'-phosphoesterase [Candidatus Methanodesulfokores washburnensis]
MPRFVVQEHHARRLHWDLRLEMDGVLKSWAVPKGIPERKGEKRLAIQTEDHDISYIDFEGTIPEGMYGAGEVKIWDSGDYELLRRDENIISFIANGSRMRGKYVLVRSKTGWILMKVS